MTYYGWSIQQWAWAAHYHQIIVGPLPDPFDTDACVNVMDAAVERFGDPSDPQVLLVNYLGQVSNQTLTPDLTRWAARFVCEGAKQLKVAHA